MKIKSDYKLRTIAGEHIVVPTGKEAVNFNGIITLNNSGKHLFETLQLGATKETLIEKLMDVYEVDQATAQKDVEAFIKILESKNLLD